MAKLIFLDDFITSVKLFAASNPSYEESFAEFDFLRIQDGDIKNIFSILSNMLFNSKYIPDIVKYFRKYILQLISIAIPLKSTKSMMQKDVHLLNCYILSQIVQLHPDIRSYTLQYFDKYPAPFNKSATSYSSITKRPKLVTSEVSDFELVYSCYMLLQSCADFCRTKWNWSEFIETYIVSKNNMIKWICCQCIGILSGMNEKQLNKLLQNYFSEETANYCEIEFQKSKSNMTAIKTLAFENNVQTNANSTAQLFENVINVNGIYLPVYKFNISKPQNLVEVNSTLSNLRKIALGIAANKALCLVGPVGSGKTVLVEYLANWTGRKLGENFIKVQLGDQTDSKMLLGTYRCTDIPGEFVWQPGVLTQAVMDGSWLLLEDIDSASMDIASVITALLENGYLTVPGYRDSVPITPGFQLFVTQRLLSSITGYYKKHSNASTLLEKQVLQINVEPLNNEELQEVIQTLHPPLKTISSRMVEVFTIFSSGDIQTIAKTGRSTSTRDLFKWCARSIIGYDVTSSDSALKVLQEAIDMFCCSISSAEERLKLAKEISARLGIVDEKADYFCNKYKPSLSLSNGILKAGRCSLALEASTVSKRIKFCFTRPSSCLLERVMCSINFREPVLLVGETGTGKTSTVQYLAHTLGQKLIVINMNQQSDSADLLGGYKPVHMKFVVAPLRRQFERVFREYFSIDANKKFLEHIGTCFNSAKWSALLKLMKASCSAALKRLNAAAKDQKPGSKRPTASSAADGGSAKGDEKQVYFLNAWSEIATKLNKLEMQLKQQNALAFSFVEGSLVRAIENGYWVLLDEINLANAETLECLSGLLEGSKGSLSLLERGDRKPIQRHDKFTLFACMNPSTDVGKKDLAAGLRNRFTEFFVEELTDKIDLLMLVSSYLDAMSLPSEKIENIVKFYLTIRKEAVKNLSDGLGHKPHYSLRSLCRALTVASRNPCGTFNRSLYEAFCLSFLTQLDAQSYVLVQQMITKYMIGSAKEVKSVLNQPIAEPKSSATESFLQFEGYWVSKGALVPDVPDNYILTESVRRNLKDLVRVVSMDRLPVLLQGDTSVGKTSLIMYLAKSSGNRCVRINNHEHTDLQEYIGSYVADSTGKLVFREGVLVEAMRKGHWVILDELNLAPTDVLEALNRVLDDNRELFIPETQETVRADANFMLFATQNPPGTYGGRKMLSRAFRNRFVELHFNEIPPAELETILHKRCAIPPSYCKKMIAVMTELQTRRRTSAAFAGKQGFITLRDLFRWGERYRLAQNTATLYDWDQHLADEGYLILAGRVRKTEERLQICQVFEKHMKRRVVADNLFTLSDRTSSVTKQVLQRIDAKKHLHPNIVWTFNMRQLAVLVAKALQFGEPVLLVGETGGGKTTVCKLLAEHKDQQLVTVNCHMHTESADFIGGLRPVRDRSDDDDINRLFEWVNGPLIDAMVSGDVFLADEISLADDSVLERLNSLLEPEKTLLLAEKGSDLTSNLNSELIVAHPGFQFIGTMNPGGDFGKKELSPALRNRFTEIWCESCTDRNDLIDIVEQNLKTGLSFGNQEDGSSGIGRSIMDFVEWFRATEVGKKFTISIRDILTWVKFMNSSAEIIGVASAYVHGACLTFLDSFGSGVTGQENFKSLTSYHEKCIAFLTAQLKKFALEPPVIDINKLAIDYNDIYFGINPFYIQVGENLESKDFFSFTAPTILYNTMRLLRGLQLNKAILLEGSPGVGKTSLVTAVAKCTGNRILRINLSDQTDISDLFGADLPVEGGTGGQFAWRDGPFLQALRKGHWILLDELNLASQSVLEGLNACLDHRGEIYIPELGKTFHVKTGTRLFACQNPLKQGGSRRGLPQSFLNRFTQVYVDALKQYDLQCILEAQFPDIPKNCLLDMIRFNCKVTSELEAYNFGHKGSPWEYNLRDLTRWCEATIYYSNYCNRELLRRNSSSESGCQVSLHQPERSVSLIYSERMRTASDKQKMRDIFESVFGASVSGDFPLVYVNEDDVFVGDARLQRQSERDFGAINESVMRQEQGCLVLRSQMSALRSLTYCVNLNWMVILVGSGGSGKSSVVRTLAQLAGRTLRTLPVTSAMDTTDILGGFEQADYNRHLEDISNKVEKLVLKIFKKCIVSDSVQAVAVLRMWEKANELLKKGSTTQTMSEETSLFVEKLNNLLKLLDDLATYSDDTDDSLNRTTFIDRIKSIKLNVIKEGSLNAGGKFEWVDSILVKCLQEGCWLLVDNVNLCSPAVLDRLNALLEPNGVLTIGERGVDEFGEMIHIKPHPNFRLFLTMDPKNGEISRAMRNRGLEIYLLNENESLDENIYDLKSLINQQGLDGNKNIESLMKIHEYICSIVLGEKPTLNHMLKASFLISQQILRGIGSSVAFSCGVVDVYIKSRSSHDFSIVEPESAVISYINEILEEMFTENVESAFVMDCTLKTDELQRNSTLENIKQQLMLVNALPKISSEVTDRLALEIFVNCYTSGSLKELNFRHLCCKELFSLFAKEPFTKLNNILYDTISAKDPEDFLSIDVPMDSKWLPDSVVRCTSDSLGNKLFLMLYYNAMKCINEKQEDLHFEKSQQRLTILQCSAAVANKKISDALVSDEFLKNFLRVLQSFDIYFENVISSSRVNFSDELTITLLSYLQWRFILYQLGKTDLLAKLKIHKANTRSLSVHYKWFFKYSITAVAKLCNETIDDEFARLLSSINSATNTEVELNVINCIAKQYRKTVVKPLPETNEMKLEALEQYSKYMLSVNPFYSKAFTHILNLTILEEPFKNKLIDYIKNLHLHNVNEISQIVKLLENCHLKYDINTAKFKQSELDMLFFREYIANLAILRYYSKLNDTKPYKADQVLIRKSVGAHADFCASMELYEMSNDKRLLVKLSTQLTEYLLKSPYIFGKIYEFGGQNPGKAYISSNSSKLIPMLTKSLVNDNGSDELSVITGNFGNFREKSITNRFLHLLIWKNLFAISNIKYDFSFCNYNYLILAYKDLTCNLMKSLKIPFDDNLDIKSCTELCISEINRAYYNKEEVKHLITYIMSLQKSIPTIPEEKDNYVPAVSLKTIAKCFIKLGYLEFMFNSKLDLIDPLTKIALKLQYSQEERNKFECMKKSFELQNNVISNNLKSLHPYCGILTESIRRLEEKETHLAEKFAIRPQHLTYGTLKDIVDNIRKLVESNINMIEKALLEDESETFETTDFSSFYISLETAVTQLMKYRIGFSDIVERILCSLMNLCYGLRLATDIKTNNHPLGDIITKLIEFPALNEPDMVIAECTNVSNCAKLMDYLQTKSMAKISKRVAFKLFRIGIQEMFNVCALEIKSYALSADSFAEFDMYLRRFNSEWMKQEEEKEARAKESENLYKIVSKCDDLSEEEQDKLEMNEIFPNYHQIDFSDFYNKNLDDDSLEISANEDKDETLDDAIVYEDIHFIYSLHAQIINAGTKTEWLTPAKLNNSINYDFVTPLLQRYEILKPLVNDCSSNLHYDLDRTHVGSLNVLIALTENHGNTDILYDSSSSSPTKKGNNAIKRYNFYKDQNVDETKSSFHIIEELKIRILELLAEWNEHPTLNTILSIINRIYAFPITSPVSRFLTGFEILLSKCNEWEQNAHSGVSLSEHSTPLTHQIITWRKLELSGWKDCLNNAFERMNNPIPKWWLHMYNLMCDFILNSKNTTNELLKLVQSFVEKSNLAEFNKRLELLYIFHCHSVFLPASERRDAFMSILWNLHSYYSQFLQNVETKIKDLRSPIEKKLKDFIKIARWNDINYWAIKDAVEKTHKTLHKYIKEFETVLKEPITSCLTNKLSGKSGLDHVGIWDRPQRHSPKKYHYSLETINYLAKLLSSKKSVVSAEVEQNQGFLFIKSEKYFSKMRKLCRESLDSVAYPVLIRNLDSFVTEIIDTSNHLQSLEIDTSLTKEKQKSQAKHILNQKKMALADLFKNLAKLGLSYRTGIVESKLRAHNSPEFLLKPLNLNAMLSNLKYEKTDEKLLTLWQGCEMYFFRSVAGQAALETGLASPSADLGLPNVERIRGFSQHLTVLIQEQKSKLIETTRLLYYIRYYTTRLTNINYSSYAVVNNADLVNSQLLFRQIIHVAEQFKIFLHSCPEQPQLGTEILDVPTLEAELKNAIEFKYDKNWNEALSIIQIILTTTDKVAKIVESVLDNVPAVEFTISYPEYVLIPDMSNELKIVHEKVQQLSAVFQKSQMCSELERIETDLHNLMTEGFINDEDDQSVDSKSEISAEFLKGVDALMKSTLVIVQNIYKKYLIKKSENDDDKLHEEADSETFALNDGHLKTQLMEEIFSDIALLDLKLVLKNVHNIVKRLGKINAVSLDGYKPSIQKCLPLLDQIILFYQYFVTQQVSAYRITCKMNAILLKVFIELATKGFCIAPEFAEELKDDNEGKQSGGVGLGDGKGEKDISDQIENEDQLDDTHFEGQEKENKDEEEDCKEEGKGIEMSEDFESKLQDMEKPDDDEQQSNEEDDDDDAEKQMGDTEEGADRLDEQIWGSDEEIDEDEKGGDDKKEEKGSGGEKEEQQEITAKEDGSGKNDNEEEEENGNNEKQEKQKEINEINEPEIDDDQVDPYHGNQPELPEPEPLDLPDDLQLDDAAEKDEVEEENPFDVDRMKEEQETENKDLEGTESKDEETTDDPNKTSDNESDISDQDGDDDDDDNAEKEVDEKNESPPENEIENQTEQQPVAEDEEDKDEENNVESGLDQQQSTEKHIEAMECDNNQSADNVQPVNKNNINKTQPNDQMMEEENADKDGAGQSQMEESSTGHKGQANAQQDSLDATKEENKKQEKRRRPGKADSKHTLGDENESAKKKLKTIETENDKDDEESGAEEAEKSQKEAELYQHIKEATSFDTQVLDAATKEQAETQQVSKMEEDSDENVNEIEPNLMEEEEEDELDVNVPTKKPEKTESRKNKNSDIKQSEGDILEELKDVQVEGERIDTMTVPRGGESSHYTQFELLENVQTASLTAEEIIEMRNAVQFQLGKWNEPPPNAEAEKTWEKISSLTSSLAQDLSEQLRLVLEPTQASRLRGDFRTGRRINMRKVIPYIASQFRKDKIWLRRTKPSKREYQIVLAIDDSSSMADNHSKELAFESIALISKALSLLEAGQLSVLSFGETTEILHKLSDTFTEKSGTKLLQKFQFQQTKTCIAKLVDFVTEMFSNVHTVALNAKLLIVVSDGRGIFSEGESVVHQAVRRARFADIFMVFVIIDNPENKDSILDIRIPVFSQGKLLGIKSYMDSFPFPFYIILREINTLPTVLSDALRQWFELVSNVDNQ